MDALLAQALSMGAQASFAPQLPVVTTENPRYNRIEGLSLGARVDQQLGAGYAMSASGRIGVADREPLAELTASRSNLRRTLAVTGYNRLVSASDYGNPLSLGSSISALLFGRDEGYYYRASGVELTSTPDVPGGAVWTWGLFADQERSARRQTTFALAAGATGFRFDTNLVTQRGMFYGGRTRLVSTFGLDPESFRLLSDVRLEAARGDSGGYGRAALDLTLSHPLGRGAAALTVAGGSSVGALPVQRNWFIGGSQTVRGENGALEPGRMGSAFWLARGEAARGLGVVRPVVFFDIGWAGDRTRWRDIGRPVSGAGLGLSALDGVLRFDLARGINPDRRLMLYTYVEGRF
jgi:Hemolysin activation/secretion protein